VPVDKFAPGWNNIAGLKTLQELDPLQPQAFEGLGWLRTIWHDEEDVQRDGVGNLIPIGLPWVQYLVEILPQSEVQILRVELCPTRRAPVTIYTYNKTVDAWKYYNGQMELYQLEDNANWDRLHWKQIRWSVRELLEIAP